MLLTAVVFIRTVGHEFILYDDDRYVYRNPEVQGGLTPSGIVWAFRTDHMGSWHPLTWLSHMLDVQLFGLHPWGHHLGNVALHAGSTGLLFLALFRMTGALGASALVAALFGVHPLRMESVAWVAERKDVLSTFFWMLTLVAYGRYVARPGRWRYLAMAGVLLLGLLAKPMLVTVPFVLLLLDIWPLGRWLPWGRGPSREAARPGKKEKRRTAEASPGFVAPGGRATPPGHVAPGGRAVWVEKLPLLALVVGFALVTWATQRHAGAMHFGGFIPLFIRIENAVVSCVGYLGKTILPRNLAILYPHRAMTDTWGVVPLPTGQVALAALFLIGVTVAVFLARRRRPYLLVGWLWYLGTLGPVLGVFQVGGQAMADRYTYVPLIGVFLAAVWGLAELAERLHIPARARAAAALVVVVAAGATTVVQLGHWKNSITVFEQALRATRINPVAHYNLSVALHEAGRDAEAIPHLEAAVRIAPSYQEAQAALVSALEAAGRLQEAAVVQNNRGAWLGGRGDVAGAAAVFADALRLDPSDANVRFNYGMALKELGRRDEAAAQFTLVLRQNPDHAKATAALESVSGEAAP